LILLPTYTEMRKYFTILLFLALSNLLHAQIIQCDGIHLPEFYTMYGGSSQFTEHTNAAITTFIDAEDAIAAGEYSTAQELINSLFETYPKGSTIWWNVFNDPNGANLGTPHAYYGVRMMEDIVDYHLNPTSNPDVKTVNMKVILVGCSEGIQPSTDAELQAGTGTFISNSLDQALLEDDYCIIDQSLDLFLKYITAITFGELQVNVEYVELPDLCIDATVNTSAPYFASGNVGQVWPELDDDLLNETDWFWMLYPSHVPEFPDFDDDAFITGGMGADSKGGPLFIIDDKWLVRKPAHLGDGMYNDVERRIYLPQWLQHEFYHHLYRIYPEFSLEVNGHDWFNLSFWPGDFEGRFEADFYAESLHKRIQSACVPLADKLITRVQNNVIDLSASMIMDELLGAYSLDNIGNNWHEAEIIFENGLYYWRNNANVQWQVNPNFEDGILETGSDCPYPGQNFKIELYRGLNGELVPGTIGLIFNGELYRKRFDLLLEEAPFEIMLDTFTNECAESSIDQGIILKTNGQFYWSPNASELWALELDAENESFILGANSPFPGSALDLILLEEDCGLHAPGFLLENRYYWRPKLRPDNPSPIVANPADELLFTENFNTQSIDISSVFSDPEGELLFLFASSSEPNSMEVQINGSTIEFIGGTAGVYEICLHGIYSNGGVANDFFTVTVGDPSSIDHTEASSINIYPNPGSGQFQVANLPNDAYIRIYSSAGLLVLQTSETSKFDLSAFAEGLYFVHIRSGKKLMVEKILKWDN
jgi:hypothetical protein